MQTTSLVSWPIKPADELNLIGSIRKLVFTPGVKTDVGFPKTVWIALNTIEVLFLVSKIEACFAVDSFLIRQNVLGMFC